MMKYLQGPPTRTPAATVLMFCLLSVSHGLLFVSSTPLWEGVDEPFHYSYIQNLVEHRELPVYGNAYVSKEITLSFQYLPLSRFLNSNLGGRYTSFGEYWKLTDEARRERRRILLDTLHADRSLARARDEVVLNYEALQAPLYYLLAAFVYYPCSSLDLLTRAFILRLFSLSLGLLTIIPAFAVAKYACPPLRDSLRVPLLIALLPTFVFTIGRISNDSLAVPLYSLLVLSVLQYFQSSRSATQAVKIGIILGLGLLTKAYFLGGLLAVIAIFLAATWTQRPAKHLIRHLFLLLLCATAIAGWWYLRNYRLYGNLSGIQEVTLTSNLTLLDRLKYIPQVPWLASLQIMLKQHIWNGNGSALGLSRTVYNAGYLLITLSVLGILRHGLIRILRARSPSVSQAVSSPLAGKETMGILIMFHLCFMLGLLYHMLQSYILLRVPGGTGGWYLYACIVPEVVLLVYGIESISWASVKRFGSATLVLYAIALNLLGYFCKAIPFYSGFFIPRFHLQHFIDLYSPGNFKVILEHLSINSPSFVTPSFVAVALSAYLAILAAALGSWFTSLRHRAPAGTGVAKG